MFIYMKIVGDMMQLVKVLGIQAFIMAIIQFMTGILITTVP